MRCKKKYLKKIKKGGPQYLKKFSSRVYDLKKVKNHCSRVLLYDNIYIIVNRYVKLVSHDNFDKNYKYF